MRIPAPGAGWLWAAAGAFTVWFLHEDARLVRADRNSATGFSHEHPTVLVTVIAFCLMLIGHLLGRPRFLSRFDPFRFVGSHVEPTKEVSYT